MDFDAVEFYEQHPVHEMRLARSMHWVAEHG